MKKKTILSIVIMFSIFFSVARVFAPPVPGCVFFGYVYVGGNLAPDGLNVTAVISGTTLSWTTQTLNGTYGWPVMGSSLLKIPGNNADVSGKNGGAEGDLIVFYVQGVMNSQTAYFDIGGAVNFTLSVPQVSMPPGLNSTITATLNPTVYGGEKVTVSGILAYRNGTGIQQANVTLSYMTFGGSSWNDITSITTSAAGYYTVAWAPDWSANATENYLVKTSWEGNNAVQGCEANVALSLIPVGGTSLFSIVSNSVISSLDYNSTTRVLNFTLTGLVGTTGYANIALPAAEIGNVTGLTMYLDQAVVYYTATNDTTYWLLHFTYEPGTHIVTVNLPDLPVAPSRSQNPPFLETPLGITIVIVVVVSAAALVYVARLKLKQPNEKPKKTTPKKTRQTNLNSRSF